MMFCLNLCELLDGNITRKITFEEVFSYFEKNEDTIIERIYVGSSFCSQYFLHFSGYKELFQYCKSRQIHVTITVPVISEKDLENGKKKISCLYKEGEEIVDEFTVNDIGMLYYIQNNYNKNINLGRLFFKDPRDCRIPSYINSTVAPAMLSYLGNLQYHATHVTGIELDSISKQLNLTQVEYKNISISIHAPLCYMTTGNICKFASIHYQPDKKYRPNMHCQMECLHVMDFYSDHVQQTDCDTVLIRIGRTLYFENDIPRTIGHSFQRIIYFPIKEWRRFNFENFGTGK